MANNAHFEYDPLPPNVDALRILQVGPGDFFDTLECTLMNVAFRERPKYVALSYTWGDSYPDMSLLPVCPGDTTLEHLAAAAAEPCITINGQPFYVGHNLHLALLHLRSPVHPISLWADAICIDQSNAEERNRQVALMAFIYTRAVQVVAWIGTRRYPATTGLFRIMWLEWKAGETQHLAASLCDDSDGGGGRSNMRWSPKPSQESVARIAESRYWSRLWVIQEVCLPRYLILVYGSEAWPYEEFRRQGMQPVLDRGLPPSVAQVFDAMQRLLETRDQRHTQVMTLENLMERFASSGCKEMRDRVYGLLGCANDIYASVEDHGKDFIGRGEESVFQHRRGVGSIKVDYRRPLFEIWKSVIEFAYFQAQSIPDRVRVSVRVNQGGPEEEEEEEEEEKASRAIIDERRISIVRTAGMVQRALGQSIEQGISSSGPGRLRQTNGAKGTNDGGFETRIRAVGYVVGEIVQLGPEYSSLIGSSRAWQEWTSSWVDFCDATEDLETIRRLNEGYSAKILYLGEQDVGRIRDIQDSSVIAWPASKGSQPPPPLDSSDPIQFEKLYEDMWLQHPDVEEVQQREPRICLGTNQTIGLAPPAARQGDILVRFWNCDAAIVMRQVVIDRGDGTPDTTTTTTTTTGTATNTSRRLMLVGRADVAETINRSSTPGRDPHAEGRMSEMITLSSRNAGWGHSSGAVYIDLNMKTLQQITSHIAT